MKTWSKKKQECYHDFLEQMIKDGYIERSPKRFNRPKIDDIYNYFGEKINTSYQAKEQAELFFNHWESLDWCRGKTRVKDWKRTANTWIKNNEKYKQNGPGNNFKKESAADKTAARIAERNR